MSGEFVVAVVGATGVVGAEIISILRERKFPIKQLRALASANSAGEILEFGPDEITVEELNPESFNGVDIALFAAGGDLSEQYVPIAKEAGAWSIDNSSFFRMHKEIPLIVPEVNPDTIDPTVKIIANPNCSTIQLMPVLQLLHQQAGLKRVVVSTYQAVSGAGKAALDELFNQTRGIYNQTNTEPEAFQHQIAFNCIPQIDVFLENGYTKEEFKIVNESRKILGLPDLRITATAVRVPVFHCHGESVNVELERPITPEAFATALESVSGVVVRPVESQYPMQIEAAGTDPIYVGRIRKDVSVENGLDFWIVADNLRKGAALNAVQIAELLLARGLLTA